MISRDEFRSRFGGRCAALAVIHVDGSLVGLHRELDVVASAGMDGAFLIDHRSGTGFADLLRLAESARASYPDTFLGVNFLDLHTDEALGVAARHGDVIDAVWADNAEAGDGPEPRQAALRNAERLAGSGVVFFGGVAFKYQRAVDDLAGAARAAAGVVDVVTTSGEATGRAPGYEKIAAMRSAAPGSALAVASGITPENAGDYVEFVDAVLVATGISVDEHHLDVDRCRELVRELRAHGP